MVKIIIKYISYILVYLYLHILFIIFINKYCFSLKTELISNIDLTYNFLSKYSNHFIINEKTYFDSFNTKKIKLETKIPIFMINSIYFFNYNIGINEKLINNKNFIYSINIPKIKSEIPLYNINEFLIKLIYKQYINFYNITNEYPTITILNKKLIKIKNSANQFVLFPWTNISKNDYEKITKEKITDLRINYK